MTLKDMLIAGKLAGGGGGEEPSGTKQISISANGTTTHNIKDYASAEITVSVPNSYTAGDEGKVVSSGALVSQSSDSVTQNGVVDTTLINSLTVNVGGGGGSETIASGSFLGNTTNGCMVINVGKKMPKTNFYFEAKAQNNSEIAHDSNYTFVFLCSLALDYMGAYDLTAVGNYRPFISAFSVKDNDSGTITSKDAGHVQISGEHLRNGGITDFRPNTFAIHRKAGDTFELVFGNSNASYKWPSTVTYDYKLVYFGDNPSADIIDLS